MSPYHVVTQNIGCCQDTSSCLTVIARFVLSSSLAQIGNLLFAVVDDFEPCYFPLFVPLRLLLQILSTYAQQGRHLCVIQSVCDWRTGRMQNRALYNSCDCVAGDRVKVSSGDLEWVNSLSIVLALVDEWRCLLWIEVIVVGLMNWDLDFDVFYRTASYKATIVVNGPYSRAVDVIFIA